MSAFRFGGGGAREVGGDRGGDSSRFSFWLNRELKKRERWDNWCFFFFLFFFLESERERKKERKREKN